MSPVSSPKAVRSTSSIARDAIPCANIGELLKKLGDVPADRVRLVPSPGLATKRDLLRVLEKSDVLVELVDGTLVEKAVGQVESALGVWLIHWLMKYLESRDLGRVFGADAPHQFGKRLIRLPDVAFVSNARYPTGDARKKAIATWVPEFVVEIMSKRNTRKEVERKLDEYFGAGVLMAWIVDPRKKTVRVYLNRSTSHVYGEQDDLDGGTLLPNFSISIHEWFSKIE